MIWAERNARSHEIDVVNTTLAHCALVANYDCYQSEGGSLLAFTYQRITTW